MANETENTAHYKSLHDISLRKQELLKQIRKDQKDIGEMWNSMFRPEPKRGKKKGLSLQTVMSTGVGVLDGALFAWKLYRKFKR